MFAGKDRELRKLQKKVADAEATLAKARERKILSRYGDVVILYEDGLVTRDGSCDLTTEMHATVDTAGSIQKYVTQRITATRVAAIGVLALLAKKSQVHTLDTRELYLLVETPQFATLVSCDPKYPQSVRGLAAKINSATSRREELLTARKERVARAERAVEAARAELLHATRARR